MKNYQDLASLFIVLIFVAIVLLLPFVTGSTFGQRCAKAYPDDPAAVERCVVRMKNHGGPLYEENLGTKEFPN